MPSARRRQRPRARSLPDHPTYLTGDPTTDEALWDLARLLNEIAKAAGKATDEGQAGAAAPSSSTTKERRRSDPRRVKGREQHDRT